MFPWVGTGDITEGGVRKIVRVWLESSGVCAKFHAGGDRGIPFVKKLRTGLKSLCHNYSFASSGLNRFPPIAHGLRPWAVILRRPSTSLRAGFRGYFRGTPPTFELALELRHRLLKPRLILNGLRGAEGPLFDGGSRVLEKSEPRPQG
jgi:hypothetical protein